MTDPLPAGNAPGATPSPDELKRALKAFKKRLKLMKLDDESRIGVGPMSSGGRSGIAAIQPPDQYPREVWEALVKQGKLRSDGDDMYELVSGA